MLAKQKNWVFLSQHGVATSGLDPCGFRQLPWPVGMKALKGELPTNPRSKALRSQSLLKKLNCFLGDNSNAERSYFWQLHSFDKSKRSCLKVG